MPDPICPTCHQPLPRPVLEDTIEWCGRCGRALRPTEAVSLCTCGRQIDMTEREAFAQPGLREKL